MISQMSQVGEELDEDALEGLWEATPAGADCGAEPEICSRDAQVPAPATTAGAVASTAEPTTEQQELVMMKSPTRSPRGEQADAKNAGVERGDDSADERGKGGDNDADKRELDASALASGPAPGAAASILSPGMFTQKYLPFRLSKPSAAGASASTEAPVPEAQLPPVPAPPPAAASPASPLVGSKEWFAARAGRTDAAAEGARGCDGSTEAGAAGGMILKKRASDRVRGGKVPVHENRGLAILEAEERARRMAEEQRQKRLQDQARLADERRREAEEQHRAEEREAASQLAAARLRALAHCTELNCLTRYTELNCLAHGAKLSRLTRGAKRNCRTQAAQAQRREAARRRCLQ